MSKTPVEPQSLDLAQLNKDFDWVQSRVFMGNNSAFLSTVLCGMDFVWTRDIRTAQTNGKVLWWNPDFFQKKHAKDPRINVTILKHELWHPASLHMLRRGTREFKLWNIICDIRINNDLKAMGEYMGGFRYIWDPYIPPDMPEEEIYDLYYQQWMDAPDELPMLPWAGEDDEDADPEDQDDLDHDNGYDFDDTSADDGDMTDDGLDDMAHRDIINNIVRAKTVAEKQNSFVPGNLNDILNQFLAPVLPWEQLVQRWMQDLMESKHTWRKPNRRYQSMYMPSRADGDGRLEHLVYFLDVSYSCGDGDVTRFNSEVFYMKTVFNPKKMTLVQFHDEICDIRTITEEEDMKEVIRKGRGGTLWSCVKNYIEEMKDITAAIVFTDMGFCDDVGKPLGDIPILFAAINYHGSDEPPFPGSSIVRIQC